MQIGFPLPAKFLQLHVAHLNIHAPGATQMFRQMLGEIDRAVLAAGAAKGNHEV